MEELITVNKINNTIEISVENPKLLTDVMPVKMHNELYKLDMTLHQTMTKS